MSVTLLLVDDDDVFNLLIERAIKRAGVNVRLQYLPNGDAAIQYLSQNHPLPPSMMLLDIKMPGKTGFDVLRWKQQQPDLKNVPVVIWSTSELERDKQQARELGALSYFAKPVDTDNLVAMIKTLERLCRLQPASSCEFQTASFSE